MSVLKKITLIIMWGLLLPLLIILGNILLGYMYGSIAAINAPSPDLYDGYFRYGKNALFSEHSGVLLVLYLATYVLLLKVYLKRKLGKLT